MSLKLTIDKASSANEFMRLAITLADKAPKLPTNFRVGAVIVDEQQNRVLATGHTMEMPGNTHAEQSALVKLALEQGLIEDREDPACEEKVARFLPPNAALYTTMEPCNLRASGNLPCVDRILNTRCDGHFRIKKVYVGVQEPEKFVGDNTGRVRLEEAGIEVVHLSGHEDEILRIATAGHDT